MNKGRYVFRQMCDFLPTDKIEWIIEKYNGDRYTKTFSCWQHLLVMILAQLWQCRSLRVLVNVLNSQRGKLYQMGIGRGVCRSTLAWANEHRDYRIFEEIANLMIKNARAVRSGHCQDKYLDDKVVYAFDSSTISLCLSIFKWIKQHLYIKVFYGTSENAVRIQIYCAIIAYCLVAILERKMQLNMDIYSVLQILEKSSIDKTPLRELFENSKMSEEDTPDDSLQLTIQF